MSKTITRVLGRSNKRADLLGRYDVPAEVFELAADIHALELVSDLLRTVRWESAGEDREAAEKAKWLVVNQVDRWLAYARGIAHHYLCKDCKLRRQGRSYYADNFEPFVRRLQELRELEKRK